MLSEQKIRMLNLLAAGPTRFTDLMNKLGITKKRVAVHINELETQKLIMKNPETGLYETTEKGKNALQELELEGEAKGLIVKLGVDNAKKFINVVSKEVTKKELDKGTLMWRDAPKEWTRELRRFLDEIERWNKIWASQKITPELARERKKSTEEAKRDSPKSGPPRFVCPQCGQYLSLVAREFDSASGELGVECTCEWCDYGGFYVGLGIRYQDLKYFRDKVGSFDAKFTKFYLE